MRPTVVLSFESRRLEALVLAELPLIVASIDNTDRASPHALVVGVVTDRLATVPAIDSDFPVLELSNTPHAPPSHPANCRSFSPNDLVTAMAWFHSEIMPSITLLDGCVARFAETLSLTNAEVRVFRLLVSGHGALASALRLGLSVRSVEHQHSSLREKAGERTIAAVLSQFACFCAMQATALDTNRTERHASGSFSVSRRGRHIG
jgi:DNA-binding CsgD family transcriptional regulator